MAVGAVPLSVIIFTLGIDAVQNYSVHNCLSFNFLPFPGWKQGLLKDFDSLSKRHLSLYSRTHSEIDHAWKFFKIFSKS